MDGNEVKNPELEPATQPGRVNYMFRPEKRGRYKFDITPIMANGKEGEPHTYIIKAHQGVSAATKNQGTTAEGPDARAVKLSDPKVTFIESTKHIHFTVKYRFTNGRPKPEAWYRCILHFKPDMGLEFGAFQGKAMQREGVLEHESDLARPRPAGRVTFEMLLDQGTTRDGAGQEVSETIRGELLRKTSR
jgi:hypothetical protein